jgi:phosphatidylethanolamine-binding protein (PEBP) family uncharacterized protein
MKSYKLPFIVIGGLLFSTSIGHAADFSFKFKWCDTSYDPSNGTPEFSLSSVPKGTTKLEFKMNDLDRVTSNHGGGEIEYVGKKKIGCGSLEGFYKPPHPPSGSHTYEWTIKALDKDGNELASAKASRKYPEL